MESLKNNTSAKVTFGNPSGVHQLSTVGDFMEHLSQFDSERAMIIDSNGDTYTIDSDDIHLWNPDEVEIGESPVAIFF